MTAMEDTRHAALRYLERNWSVIPVLFREKRPAVKWQEYQYRRADENELKAWFPERLSQNLGIVTGIVSGLVVLDVDPRHRGDDSLVRLEQRYGPLPATVEAHSGGGGRHLYFAHPGGIVRNKVGIAPGIDVRGDGGYIVAPPSVHPSGTRYRWVDNHEPGALPIAPLPQWLLEKITGPKKSRGHGAAYWHHLVSTGVAEGERNSSLASLCGHLLWHGVDPEVTMELLLCWNAVRCRPRLADAEVVRIVESITRLHER